MSNGDLKMKTDDPSFRRGLRERLRMRSLRLERTRSERELTRPETTEPNHDWEAEAVLRRRFDNYKQIGFQPAQPYDEGDRLKIQCDEVERLLNAGGLEDAEKELDRVETMTEAVMKLVGQRVVQEHRLPADPLCLGGSTALPSRFLAS